jgi:acetyltransferase-like isoleucine patch superfamily enzyme
MRLVLRALLVLVPWKLRRVLLQALYGYRLDPTSRIGLAWAFPAQLVMERGASIGHFTVVKGLSSLRMGQHSRIGRLNWISAFPTGTKSPHFAHLADRAAELVVGDHAAITHRHIIDCTASVTIGRFATMAGYRSQILTHSVDLTACRQDAKPVHIGDYSFVGTASTLLGGAVLPDHSVLGANALLNRAHTEPYRLYAGVPAGPITALDPEMCYFKRAEGYII